MAYLVEGILRWITIYYYWGGLSIAADLTEYNPLHVYFYQAGFVIEIIFFTLALNFMNYHVRLEKVLIQLRNARLVANQLRIKQEANRLKREVDEKNRELTSKAIIISQKETIIKSVVKELSSLKKNGSGYVELDTIIKSIKSSGFHNDWKEFEIHFNRVHPDFYKELNRLHPDLTVNERKICAFLKLNFTSKDIAEITGKSVNTIDVARARLRKKMKLSTSDNISAVIANIG